MIRYDKAVLNALNTGETGDADLKIKTEQFEGPLDLLLFLIQTHELDISRLSISQVTDQFLAYVRRLHAMDFDLASDFLLMAATLLLWKSRALLPKDPLDPSLRDDEDDGILTPEKLIRQLLEHKRFLSMGAEIAKRPKLYEDVFTRSNPRPPIERVWRDLNMSDLALGMQDILVRAHRRKKILRKETVSLTEKILEFATKLRIHEMTAFKRLVLDDSSRAENVVTFLASLELARLKKLKLHQEKIYGPLWLELVENLEGFNPELAVGFEMPALPTEGPGL